MIKYQSRKGDRPEFPSYVSAENQDRIIRMEEGGATVVLEDGSSGYVVKVRQPGHRQIRSGSTSGYPISDAFEQWEAIRP